MIPLVEPEDLTGLPDLSADDEKLLLAAFSSPRATAPLREQREYVLNTLCAIVGADSWLWAYSSMPVNEHKPSNVFYQARGVPLYRGIAVAVREFEFRGHVPEENRVLADLTRRGAHFTRSILQLVDARYWERDFWTRLYKLWLGIDDTVISVRPFAWQDNSVHFVGIHLGRFLKRPRFSARDRAIVHRTLSTQSCLHETGRGAAFAQALCNLTPSQRVTLSLLLDGRGCKDWTGKKVMGRELLYSTLKSDASRIYKAMGVKSRSELLAAFSAAGQIVPAVLTP